MTLLDTNALIWLEKGHHRAKPLTGSNSTLYISPASLLELQMLNEVGQIRLSAGALETLTRDERWMWTTLRPRLVPPSTDISWTRDPFDRLIVAHARLRGWRLATGDGTLLAQLGARERLEL